MTSPRLLDREWLMTASGSDLLGELAEALDRRAGRIGSFESTVAKVAGYPTWGREGAEAHNAIRAAANIVLTFLAQGMEARQKEKTNKGSGVPGHIKEAGDVARAILLGELASQTVKGDDDDGDKSAAAA